MNLGEAKERALSLIAEYSVDGSRISDSENADYLNRMNRFSSDAQMEISEQLGIEASFTFEQDGTNESGYNRYELPTDFKEHRLLLRENEIFLDYRIQNQYLMLKKGVTGSFELLYYKYPQELTVNTPDSYEFEIALNGHALIPYYVGGMVIADENTAIADRLLNIYFTRLQSLTKRNEDYPQLIHSIFHV